MKTVTLSLTREQLYFVSKQAESEFSRRLKLWMKGDRLKSAHPHTREIIKLKADAAALLRDFDQPENTKDD